MHRQEKYTKAWAPSAAKYFAEDYRGQIVTMPLFCALRRYVNSNYLGSKRFPLSIAIALFAAAPMVLAAKQGQVGIRSTASIGIRFEVRPFIHARQMSLSTHGSAPLPSSSGRHLCLDMKNVAGFTLNTLAHGEAAFRLTPVVYQANRDSRVSQAGCAGQTVRLPAHLQSASTDAGIVLMISVL